MIFLILCIISSAGIFVTFKYIENKQTDLLTAIITNYFVAAITGLIINSFTNKLSFSSAYTAIPAAVIIGVLFIVMFFVIGISTRHAGMTITTLASKMSVVIPIMFSIFIDPADRLTSIKMAAFVLALVAIGFTVYKKPETSTRLNLRMFLPLLLFAGMGIVDSMVKFAQQYHVSSEKSAIFSTMVFFVAFVSGLIVMVFRKKNIRKIVQPKNILPGVVLGLFNYGSIYFIIKALNHQTIQNSNWLDSSVIFGLNNTGIVVLNTFIGYFYFREKLLKVNWIGISLALVVIYILSIT